MSKRKKEYWPQDITWCANTECKETECMRNQIHIVNPQRPHSIAVFEGTEDCCKYETSSNLISRSALIEEIERQVDELDNDENRLLIVMIATSIINTIKRMPALEVKEQIVGELEKETEVRNKTINDFMNKLCDHCMRQTNECYQLECPFCGDGCDVVNIAEQMKVVS